MTLMERAQALVRGGNPRELYQLLTDCLEAGTLEALTAVQLLAEDMHGDIMFNFELKAPAAWCLVAWGPPGLQALLEMTRRTPTSKNFSFAFQLFSTLAAGERPADLWLNDALRERVDAKVQDWDGLFESAQARLNELVLDIPDDDEAASRSAMAIQFLSLTRPGAVKALFLAMSARWLSIGARTLAAYDRLLAEHPSDEPRIHAFLEAHPQLLDPMVLECWSKPDLHGAAEPDFVLRRIDGSYLVVEIETPAKALTTADNQLSAHATHAIAQALEYKAFLIERFAEAAATFPAFQPPDCLVVLGLEGRLQDGQKRILRLENGMRAGLRIISFDWLLTRAQTVAHNVVHGRIDVRKFRMI